MFFSLGNLPKDEEERLEVISIPDLRTIDIVQLNENSRMFAVASSSILFLREAAKKFVMPLRP